MAGAPLSSLALYYLMQAFPAEMAAARGGGRNWHPAMRDPTGAACSRRNLLAMSQWRTLYLFELGLATLSLAAVLA